MDPNQYQQYADFYWHNYTESAALPWDYPPPMHQTYSYPRPRDSRGSLPGAGGRRANTKEVVVVDSLTDSDSEKGDQPQDDREKSTEVGLCACCQKINWALIGNTLPRAFETSLSLSNGLL